MKSLRWFNLIGGILLVILGIISFATPVANLAAISIAICLIVIIYGIFLIIAYSSFPKAFRSGWMLVMGILSILLGIWMLSSGGITALTETLPYIFAVWLMVSSLSLIASSIDLKDMKVSGWVWELILGIIGVVLGFILMFDPITSALTLSFMLAYVFLFKGISDIIVFFTTRNIDA